MFLQTHALRMPRLATVVLALVVASVAFIACTSDQPAVIPTMTPAIEQPVESEPTLDTEELPAFEAVDPDEASQADDPSDGIAFPPGAKHGGVFTISTGNAIVPDPVISRDSSGRDANAHWLLSEIFSGLTKIAAESPDVIQPDLAESLSVSEQGRMYEFTLNKDLKFSDGSPVTAADFKWSWERALNPATRSVRAFDVLGAIQGAAAIVEGETSELSGVEAVDDRVLTVSLSEPTAHFLALLADPVASVLKKDNVVNWGIDWAAVEFEDATPRIADASALPIGTGPFRLEDLNFLYGPFVLVRNENYHERPPYLDGVVGVYDHLGPDWEQQEVAAFVNEQLDMSFFADEAVRATRRPVVQSPRTSFLVLNVSLEPFDDPDFRKSLAAAIDRIDFAFPGAASISPAYGITPQGFSNFDAGIEVIDFDPERARLLLSKSRHADWDGVIELATNSVGFFEDHFGTLGLHWLDTLGIRSRYTPQLTDRYLNTVANNEWQMMAFAIQPEFPDPYAIFRFLDSAFLDPDASPEIAEVMAMFRDASSEQDEVQRRRKYVELEQHLIDEAIVLPVRWWSGESSYGFQSWVNGFHWPKYGGSKFKDVWFDETAPDRVLPLP